MRSPRLRSFIDSNVKQRLKSSLSSMTFSKYVASSRTGSVWVLWSVLKYITGADFQYRDARWGLFGHIASLFGMFNTHNVRQLHWNINTWKDEEVLAWKISYMSACSAIQVTGAIFASVGLSALSLPNMDSTHWSARALLSCSMMLGILSVVFAASQQQHIGMLNNALEIRLWLSRGKLEPDKRPYDMPYNLLPLESSVSAFKQFSLPKYLLTLSVYLYAIGFGIYLLYAWLDQVEPNGGRNDFRNILIAFVATVGVVCIYSFVLFIFSLVDAGRRSEQFNLDHFQSFAKSKSQQQLEEWLKVLEDMQEISLEVGQERDEYELLHTRVNELILKWREERRARLKRQYDARNEMLKRKPRANDHEPRQHCDTQDGLKNLGNTDPESAVGLSEEVSSA